VAADYPPIADYALIGDGHTCALVCREGSIDWLCLPRPDDASCFGRLLDRDRGGYCVVGLDEPEAAPAAHEYVDGTLVLTRRFAAEGGEAAVTDCLVTPCGRLGGFPSPEILRVIDGERGAVRMRLTVAPRFEYGAVDPWVRRHGSGLFSAIGSHQGLVVWSDAPLELDDRQGVSATVTVRAGERLRLSIRWLEPALIDAGALEPSSPDDADGRLEATLQWWREWSQGTNEEDPAVLRSALALKGLTYAPTGAVTAAATTSLPEGPGRTWDYRFSWIRDSVLATRSLAELGFVDEADAFRGFIERSSAGSARDLQVLFGVGGERRLGEQEIDSLEGWRGCGPVRAGNGAHGQLQLDALGQLVEQSWAAYERGQPPDDDWWRFISELVDEAVERWREPDRGIWEWRGEPLHFVHSKALCWAAADRGLRLAEACMRKAPERRWRRARDEIREAVETEGYDEQRGVFVQVFGTRDLDAALLRLPAVGFVAWDDERMVRTTDAIVEELGEDGLLYRYKRDDGLEGGEATFVACAFWLARCLAEQGRAAEARSVFDRAVSTASPLGLFSEEYDPGTGEMLGNYPQALSHLSHIEAALAL
jgi:GH15 family glucan-1,4-alpha-glucosidase